MRVSEKNQELFFVVLSDCLADGHVLENWILSNQKWYSDWRKTCFVTEDRFCRLFSQAVLIQIGNVSVVWKTYRMKLLWSLPMFNSTLIKSKIHFVAECRPQRLAHRQSSHPNCKSSDATRRASCFRDRTGRHTGHSGDCSPNPMRSIAPLLSSSGSKL